MKIRLRNRLRMCALFSLLLAYGLQSAQAQTYRVLFQFRAGMDGAAPLAGLVSDPNGNLYGTTSSDGAFDSGVVFKISAPHKETVLHSFTGSGGDGEYPLAGLVRDAAGSLYGTTANGGVYGGACGGFGCGTVFKVNSAGREIVLHRFTGSPDASTPYSGLVRDEAGNLYGTTFSGGQYGFGTVFEIKNTSSGYASTPTRTATRACSTVSIPAMEMERFPMEVWREMQQGISTARPTAVESSATAPCLRWIPMARKLSFTTLALIAEMEPCRAEH